MHHLKSVSSNHYFSNFEIVTINKKYYYFTASYPNISITKWDTNWASIQVRSHYELGKHPIYMKVIDSSIFISSDEILFKATLNFDRPMSRFKTLWCFTRTN